ncbi:MAG: type ISP restriction/modification enzyme [Thermodesulfobacteriota bacterium]
MRKEKCPDGSKDENVFDIRQGVAIALFIKKRDGQKECKVYRSEIWGLREKKYDWLLENDINTTKWEKLSPKYEFYLFITRGEKLLEQYDKYPKITEIFPLNGVGMTTARDSFVIDKEKNTLLNRIRLFKNSKYSDDELHSFFQINKKKGWSIRKAWNMLQSISDSDLNKFILPVLYRPFDIQWIFYHDSVVWRTVKRIMRHMVEKNIGFLFTRPQSPKYQFSVVVSEKIIDQCAIGNKSAGAGISYIAPLYLYPDKDKKDLFSSNKRTMKRQTNISPQLLIALAEVFKKEPTPEEVLYYIYAVFYSNIYRSKYAEFLRTDFPRIPFNKDYRVFYKMGEYGKRLVDLHLLKSNELDRPIAKFQGKGDYKVEKVKYKQGKVYINNDQHFEGISPEVWEYQIGGYQVCDKWLKDRKGRVLSLDDIRHYCKVVTSIGKTIEVHKAIDEIFSEVEKETIDFKL